jgi:hypothetical protein
MAAQLHHGLVGLVALEETGWRPGPMSSAWMARPIHRSAYTPSSAPAL